MGEVSGPGSPPGNTLVRLKLSCFTAPLLLSVNSKDSGTWEDGHFLLNTDAAAPGRNPVFGFCFLPFRCGKIGDDRFLLSGSHQVIRTANRRKTSVEAYDLNLCCSMVSKMCLEAVGSVHSGSGVKNVVCLHRGRGAYKPRTGLRLNGEEEKRQGLRHCHMIWRWVMTTWHTYLWAL